MQTPARISTVICLFATVAAMTGCGEFATAIRDSNTYRTLQTIQQVNQARFTAVNAGEANPDTADDEQPEDTFVVDAMVGQINGRPVYASQVIEAIGPEQLTRLGADLPTVQFRQEAYKQIFSHLRTRITDELILAEATDNLVPEEKAGLEIALGQYREELVNRFGNGSPTIADRSLREESGDGLDRTVQERRERMIIDKYLRDKIWPQVHVSRQTIERFYADNDEEYNPAPLVGVRVIFVKNEAAAQRVAGALASGGDFEATARQFADLRADQGGYALEVNKPLAEFNELGWPTLNEAIQKFDRAGQVTNQVKVRNGFAWARLEKLEMADSIPLDEVYASIERKLQVQRYNLLFRRYIAELLASGSFTDVEEMATAILQVAATRYTDDSRAG